MFGLSKKEREAKARVEREAQEKASAAVGDIRASKGYHSCIDTCEKDIANLETECANLRKDNESLMGKVATLQTNEKTLREDNEKLSAENIEKAKDLKESEERIAELEQRLEEADKKNEGTPVKYASARKSLSKAKLAQLRKQLESVPAGANGFGGSCSIYTKKTRRISMVEFKSAKEALEIVAQAEKGDVEIIM